MDKETIESFLMPFTPEAAILCRMVDGSLADFSGITYTFLNGEGVIVLELPQS